VRNVNIHKTYLFHGPIKYRHHYFARRPSMTEPCTTAQLKLIIDLPSVQTSFSYTMSTKSIYVRVSVTVYSTVYSIYSKFHTYIPSRHCDVDFYATATFYNVYA